MSKSEADTQHPWAQPWYRVHPDGVMTFCYLVLIHLLSVMGIILFPLPGWDVFLTALVLTCMGGFGTTLAYHRGLSHRAFRLNPVVEQVLIFMAVFNGSGVPARWTANHRHHHAKSDTIDDVSSPRYGGFWWSHLRCLYQLAPSDTRVWCPDLRLKRYLIWERLQAPILVVSLISGGLAFGWAGFFWIGGIRLAYSLHLQAAVNSILHMRPGVPEGAHSARNLWWLGPLQLTAWGENWHENHHSAPSSARFGRRWWQVDIGWYTIRLLEAMGLATRVRAS